MKTISQFSLLSILILFLHKGTAIAQEYRASNYYYNNFDQGVLGTGFTQVGNAAALAVTKLSAENNLTSTIGYALSSTGNGVAGGLQTSFYNNDNLNNETYGNEWTLIYRNNGGNTDDSETISNGKNAWKYWLYSVNNDINTPKGYYLTQVGSTLYVKYYEDQYNKGNVLQFNIANNVTYVIRIQRLKRSNGRWLMYVDQYKDNKKEATTLVDSKYDSRMSKYATGGIFCASTSDGRFKFDEIKAYNIQLKISGANDTANGISSPLYAGQKGAVIYGVKVEVRGFMDLIQMVIQVSGVDITRIFDGRMYLRKSTDSYFGNADDELITTMDYYNGTIQKYGDINQKFYSVGDDNGAMLVGAYYYLTVDIKDTPLAGNFKFTGTPTLYSSDFDINYAANGSTVVDVATGGNTAGSVKDWVGKTSSDWNTASNWAPAGVPGETDLARIGVVTFSNQPVLNANATVGNIKFGAVKIANLVVNSILTVVNSVDNVAGITISGTGKLKVNGSFIATPIAETVVTVPISQLELTNLILNSQNAALTFLKDGNNILVANMISMAGGYLNTFNLSNGANLTLNGAKPFNLAGNYSLSLLAGTVTYKSDNSQVVRTGVNYGNISFTGLGTKKISSGSFGVAKNWTSAGGKIDFISNESIVQFNGNDAQNITDLGSNAGNGVDFFGVSFTGGNTKTFSQTGKFAVAARGSLTMGANTILQTSNNLTFKADADGFGVVDVIPASASIQGKVVAEKYVKGGNKNMWRTYRMLSSPVYDNSDVFTNKDLLGNRTYSFSQFIDDMIVTGKGGAANGFDDNSGSSASAWIYNNGYIAIPSINTNVNVGQGAYLFFRGNRDNFAAKVTSPFVDAENTIVDFEGILNQQDVTIPLVHGSTGYSLLGNPYQAVLDWNNVVKSANVEAVFRIWNPSNRQYAVFNGLDGVNGGSRYIQPGQSFFVKTTNNQSPVVTFKEASKAPLAVVNTLQIAQAVAKDNGIVAKNTKLVMGTQSQTLAAQPARVRISVANNYTENSDETLVVFMEGGDAAFAGNDVLRDGGEGVFLSSRSADSKELAINYMPTVYNVNSVPLTLTVGSTSSYTLRFTLTDIPTGYQIKLKDNFLNTVANLDNGNVTNYTFEADKNIAASFGNDRFEILISPVVTLPVTLSSFNAVKTNQGVDVKWTTAEEHSNSHFIVERAGDDKNYFAIGTIAANDLHKYNLLDKTPLNGNNYYRLVQVDFNGKSTLSNPVVINYAVESSKAELLVYPTVVDQNFILKYNAALNENRYLIKILDVTGKQVYTSSVDKHTLSNGYNGALINVAAGIYFVELLDTVGGVKLGTTKIIKK